MLRCPHPDAPPKELSIFPNGRPSRRRQKKAAPQGERFLSLFSKDDFRSPEDRSLLRDLSKGVRTTNQKAASPTVIRAVRGMSRIRIG